MEPEKTYQMTRHYCFVSLYSASLRFVLIVASVIVSGLQLHLQVHAKRCQSFGRVRCSAAPSSYRSKKPEDLSVLVVGPTGYIGKFVAKELIKRGYRVVLFAREKSGVKGKNTKQDLLQVGLYLQDFTNVPQGNIDFYLFLS